MSGRLERLRAARLLAREALDVLRGRQELTPSADEIAAVGGGDFVEVGRHLAGIATGFGGLQRHERILDIGCGVGRLAIPLTTYLTTGEYTGFDVSRSAVRWCARSITPRHPNFWFNHVDLANTFYNPGGALQASAFVFPCADASVDLAFASSVFTHLVPSTADRYVAETARVLKPGGRAVLSFYLLDAAIRESLGTFHPKFAFFPEPFYAIADETNPEAAVAYDVGVVSEALRRSGLSVVRIARGEWSHQPDPLSYQDFVLARRG